MPAAMGQRPHLGNAPLDLRVRGERAVDRLHLKRVADEHMRSWRVRRQSGWPGNVTSFNVSVAVSRVLFSCKGGRARIPWCSGTSSVSRQAST